MKKQANSDLTNFLNLGATSGVTSLLLGGIGGLDTAHTDQSVPLGELFSDYVLNKKGWGSNKAGGPSYVALPTAYRKSSDISGASGVFADFLDFLSPSVGEVLYSDDAKPVTQFDEKAFLNTTLNNEVNRELNILNKGEKALYDNTLKGYTPDKLLKHGITPAEAGALASVRTDPNFITRNIKKLSPNYLKAKNKLNNALKDFALAPGSSDNLKGIIRTSRNDINLSAHEFGHLIGLNEILDEGKKSEGLVNKVIMPAWRAVSEPAINTIGRISPGFRGKLEAGFDKLSPLFADALKLPITSVPLAGLTVAPLAFSETVREGIKNLDPTGVTHDAVDWVGENPEAATLAAYTPFLLNELYTTPSGGELIHSFWSDLQKGTDFFKTHPLTKEVKTLYSNKKPWLETAKYLGKNTLRVMTPALGLLAASYLGKRIFNSEEEESVSEEDSKLQNIVDNLRK